MSRPDKICTFCGKKDGPFHKEDVLAKWMMRELPHKKPWTKVINRKSGKFFVTRSGLGLVTRAVCKTCNGGWMSRLEYLARPILQPMMTGKPRTLSAEDQLILVRWLMKTAMMMEFVPDAIPMFFQSRDRRGFFESFAIPDKTGEGRKGSEPSIDIHFDWVYSLARWPDRCASSIRGQSIMCLAAGTGAKQSSELRLIGNYFWICWTRPAGGLGGRFTPIV